MMGLHAIKETLLFLPNPSMAPKEMSSLVVYFLRACRELCKACILLKIYMISCHVKFDVQSFVANTIFIRRKIRCPIDTSSL